MREFLRQLFCWHAWDKVGIALIRGEKANREYCPKCKLSRLIYVSKIFGKY
jgi:hypothetical protein